MCLVKADSNYVCTYMSRKAARFHETFSRPTRAESLPTDHRPDLSSGSTPPEMVDPDGGRSIPPSVNSGTHPSSMLKMLSLMDASTTCALCRPVDRPSLGGENQ